MTRRTAYLLGLATAPLVAVLAVILAADAWAAANWIGDRLP